MACGLIVPQGKKITVSKWEPMDWKEYQEKVAEFFRSIGAKAETNVTVTGARGVHAVDVHVTFNLWGQPIVWVCECKFWKSSIPKEKILTLYQISQDIGADRGFVFSEQGFQSGAIRATRNTNISLTSLEEISETAKEDFYQTSLIRFLKKANSLKKSEKNMWIDDLSNPNTLKGIDFDEVVFLDGTLLYLSLAIQKALDKKFPISYGSIKGNTIRCTTQEELLRNLETELKDIESKIQKLLLIEGRVKIEIFKAKAKFISSVKDLLITGEDALFPKNNSNPEKLRLVALRKMQEVGKNADSLKEISRGSIRKKLSETMGLLIDTVYLHLTLPTIDINLWNDSKAQVLNKIDEMKNLMIY